VARFGGAQGFGGGGGVEPPPPHRYTTGSPSQLIRTSGVLLQVCLETTVWPDTDLRIRALDKTYLIELVRDMPPF